MSSLKSNAQYPHHFSIETLIRPNILSLTPYRCARDDYQTGVLLDANENSLGPTTASAVFPSSENMHLNRYPDPSYRHLKERFATFRGLPSEDFVFFGVGSDEVIDLLIRVTCQPSRDKVLITPPTYGMYSVCAQVNDVAVVRVPLDVEEHRFQIRLDEIKRVLSEDPLIKLVFVCSPGNPTGTLIPIVAVRALLEFPDFKGIVVVDEAYIDFAGSGSSAAALVDQYANLCVLQTLSKSFGLAGIRFGIALAQPPLIRFLSNTKAPYNISSLTAQVADAALSPEGIRRMQGQASSLTTLRLELQESLRRLRHLGVGEPIGGNHANFLLTPILQRGTGVPNNERSQKVYKKLAEEMGVVVRFRGGEHGCTACLRITVGTKEENALLLEKLEMCLNDV